MKKGLLLYGAIVLVTGVCAQLWGDTAIVPIAYDQANGEPLFAGVKFGIGELFHIIKPFEKEKTKDAIAEYIINNESFDKDENNKPNSIFTTKPNKEDFVVIDTQQKSTFLVLFKKKPEFKTVLKKDEFGTFVAGERYAWKTFNALNDDVNADTKGWLTTGWKVGEKDGNLLALVQNSVRKHCVYSICFYKKEGDKFLFGIPKELYLYDLENPLELAMLKKDDAVIQSDLFPIRDKKDGTYAYFGRVFVHAWDENKYKAYKPNWFAFETIAKSDGDADVFGNIKITNVANDQIEVDWLALQLYKNIMGELKETLKKQEEALKKKEAEELKKKEEAERLKKEQEKQKKLEEELERKKREAAQSKEKTLEEPITLLAKSLKAIL